jgi:hypothetical protein
MTQAETRGRGRPKLYDENELLARVHSIDDLIRVRDALEANGEGITSRNAFGWLAAKWAGDETGGGVTRQSEFRYRAALARLGPKDPLRGPKSKRNGRIVRPGEPGSVHPILVAAGAGVGSAALAALSAPEAVHAVVRALAPIMLRTPQELTELDLAA